MPNSDQMLSKSEPLLALSAITKTFRVARGKFLHAVDGVDLEIFPGEILGLVGESGCGKSTLGRMIIGLLRPAAGTIRFRGKDLNHSGRRALCREIQMIFQDPYSSLNPRMTVRDIVAEGPDALGLWSPRERLSRVGEWLERVGLHPDHASRYPHEFSGGQRQRIGIARALALDPTLVICDEPISALDVSVQAQIVGLLRDLQRERGLTYLFIAHDLSMVRVVCNRMAVMYLGKIVEMGTASEVYDRPQHPYTQALVAANPIPDPAYERRREHRFLEGEIVSPVNPEPGCRFSGRCPVVEGRCRHITPALKELQKSGTRAACHRLS